MAEPRRVPLIGLVGKARSGKDSVAARLVEAHGYVRVAFADPLKQAALAVNPIVVCGEGPDDPFEPTLRLADAVRLYGWEVAKDEIPEVRSFLQNFGQAVRDVLGEDIWRDRALAEADRLHDAGVPVAITDVRYRNEAAGILARGGVLVRVLRPGNAGAGNHRSETDLDSYKVTWQVWNDGTLADLEDHADNIAELAQERTNLR